MFEAHSGAMYPTSTVEDWQKDLQRWGSYFGCDPNVVHPYGSLYKRYRLINGFVIAALAAV